MADLDPPGLSLSRCSKEKRLRRWWGHGWPPLVPVSASRLQDARMGLGWLGLLWHVLLPVFRGLEYPFPNLQMQVLWFSFFPPDAPPQASQMALGVGGAFPCLPLTSPSVRSAAGVPSKGMRAAQFLSMFLGASSSSRASVLLNCPNQRHGCHLMPLLTPHPMSTPAQKMALPPTQWIRPQTSELFSTLLSLTPHPPANPLL